MNGNTLKTGLLIAQEQITITTLNSTFPRTQRRMKEESVANEEESRKLVRANGLNVEQNSRRLVFYTKDFPVTINSVLDNNQFCGRFSTDVQCAIIASTSCVILEEGDDEQQVRSGLLAGIGLRITNGEFEAAIPPEHRLPGN